MSNRNNRYRQGRSRERSPLGSHRPSTSYGGCSQPDLPPPSYETAVDYNDGGNQEIPIHQHQRDSSPLRHVKITTGRTGVPFIFLVILAQVVTFIFFYDFPTKIHDYNKATARMREQQDAMSREATHLESERIALRGESSRLEKQRLELESTILELEGERDALESAIRRSEQERLRFEQEKQLLEDERHLMEHEKEEWREERERWEKARKVYVPQGAFWAAGPWPAWDCRSYGKREYWAELHNIPDDWTDLDACMNMPTTIKGVSLKRPDRCGYVADSSHIHGFWMVDWNQVDCKPRHDEVTDMGCTNPGSGTRRIKASVVGINDKPGQDWRLLCETTPFTWNRTTYNSPTHCEAPGSWPGTLTSMLAYGYPVQPEKDSLVDLVNTIVYQFGQGTDPNVFLVDVASALEYVPAWSPGAGWKPTAEKAKKTLIPST